jgi:hypothetical protein
MYAAILDEGASEAANPTQSSKNEEERKGS